MIHLHVFFKEEKNKVIIEVSREITKSETKNEISAASNVIRFISKPQDFIQFSDQKEEKDPGDWWKDEGGEPFKRN